MNSQLLYPVYSLQLNVPPTGASGPNRTLIQTGLRIYDAMSLNATYLVLSKQMFGRIRPDRVFFGFEYFRSIKNGKFFRSLEDRGLGAPYNLLHAFTKTGYILEFPGYYRNALAGLLIANGVDSDELA